MTDFTLDTSGKVVIPADRTPGARFAYDQVVEWPDLSPFEQGYVEALFASLHGQLCMATVVTSPGVGARRIDPKPTGRGGCSRRATAMEGSSFLCGPHAKNPPTPLRKSDGQRRSSVRSIPTAFSALAHSTLAAIKKDCAAFFATLEPLGTEDGYRQCGGLFWTARQEGMHPDFPPLIITLGDDGLVYLREAK